MTSELVTPGDEVGKTEEFLGGDNTFVEDGGIYASVTGHVQEDGKKITVDPSVTTPPIPKLGDIVIGEVFRLTNGLALVRLKFVEGKERREIPSDEVAALHISNISQDYVDELEDVVQEGDIVKAKVTDPTSGDIDLTSAAPELGVISARCERCGTRLRKEGDELVCPDCGNTEKRKISQEYR